MSYNRIQELKKLSFQIDKLMAEEGMVPDVKPAQGSKHPLGALTNVLTKGAEELKKGVNNIIPGYQKLHNHYVKQFTQDDMTKAVEDGIKSKLEGMSLMDFLKQWLDNLWKSIQNIPNTAVEGWDNLKQVFKKLGAQLQKYWDEMKKGVTDDKGNNNGLDGIWNNASQTYKVAFIVAVLMVLAVVIYMCVKPDMVQEAIKSFVDAVKNIKQGIVKALKQGTFKGIINAIIQMFTGVFKVLGAMIDALIDSGIIDVLVVCTVVIGLAGGLMYYKITGKVPFAENFKKSARIKKIKNS